MTRYLRWLAVGGVASALLVWSLVLATNGTAADEDKEVRDGILKLADAEAKGDTDAAKKQAQAIAGKVEEIAPVMDLMKPRGDGGLGVGSAPGKITPDGIEKKLIAMAKDAGAMKSLTPQQMAAQAEALGRMGDAMAAIAEVAKLKCPVKKKEGQKDPKDWDRWTDEMQKGAREFAEAAKAKDAAKLRTVTLKLNSTCSDCHSVFRD
jgi:hypothetical protein